MASVAAQASHIRLLLSTVSPLHCSLSHLPITYLAILVAPALVWGGFQLAFACCTWLLKCQNYVMTS